MWEIWELPHVLDSLESRIGEVGETGGLQDPAKSLQEMEGTFGPVEEWRLCPS